MKKAAVVLIIIAITLVLSGCPQTTSKSSDSTDNTNDKTIDDSQIKNKAVVYFKRVGGNWILYKLQGKDSKATGLKVKAKKNPSSEDDEQIYSAVSPDGKQIAYLQKPAWPHTINLANIDGSSDEELVGPAKPTPTHAVYENSLQWSEDGKSVIYSVTWNNCGEDGEGSIDTILNKIDVDSKKSEELNREENSCEEDQVRSILSG